MIPSSQAIEALDVPVLVIGLDLRVALANSVAHELLGFPPGDLRGLPMLSLLGPRRQAELRNFEQVLEGGGGARRLRSVLRRHDGRPAHVSLMLTPCTNVDGRVVAVSVRLDKPEMASAAASAAASHSRPSAPQPVPSVMRPKPPAGDTPATRDTLPEFPSEPGHRSSSEPPAAMHSATVPPPAPRSARLSEHRLSQPRDAPNEAVLAELEDKLTLLSERLDQLQRQLRFDREDGDAKTEPARLASEMRGLLTRSLELSEVLTGRRKQTAR